MSYPSRKMMNTWNDFRNKSCECGGDCCSVNEDVKHIPKAKNKLQKLIKDESKFRLHMNELALIMSKDDVNKDLANDIIKSYKSNVTNFMRDVVRAVKKVK